ncbi:antitoxin [Altererythrobacter xixiisoli]|uniref:Antitoxin n=1 Tax=Croceibacterium xixiisoli TaxID=1476466 RepID=A0A6I4TZ86_9SPHN|nr:antitoxin [Croceibacterium xixiisoli]MXP00372.1 antitoxin [Croceibacterium xixiisoli]
MSRLTIDITEQQHKNLKALAALQGKTIKQYALERLFPANMTDASGSQELKALLAKRIADGLAGDVSSKTVDAIIGEELPGQNGI